MGEGISKIESQAVFFSNDDDDDGDDDRARITDYLRGGDILECRLEKECSEPNKSKLPRYGVVSPLGSPFCGRENRNFIALSTLPGLILTSLRIIVRGG